MNPNEEFERKLRQIGPARCEYLRRWSLCHIAIRKGNWDAARKWAYLCMMPDLYESAKRLHDQGIDLSGGFL